MTRSIRGCLPIRGPGRPHVLPLFLSLGLCCGLSLAVPPPARAAQAAAPDVTERIQGNWLTQGHDGIIRIFRTASGSFAGRIVGGDDPDGIDRHSPDPGLRGRRLWGSVILTQLHYDGAGRWSGGRIYDPDNGRTYGCSIEYTGGDTLRIRGFWGISLLGMTQRWTRYTGTLMKLPRAR